MRIGRRLVAAAALIAAFPAAAPAQPAKSGAVKIDFRALGDDGVPVSDLKAEEISLKVNGKARPVHTLNLFRTTGGDAAVGGALPLPYGSNAGGVNGRTIHVLIDDDSLAPGREAQVREAVRLITAEMGPSDRIG